MRCQNSAEPGMGAWPPTTRGSPRCPCGNRAATKRWHRSGEPREQPEQGWGSPEPARRRPPGGPARPRTRRGSGGCGLGVGIAAGSRVRPPGKGVGSWEGTGGTAGSVDNVFGDVKDDLGSFCAQVMQRLIKKKKKEAKKLRSKRERDT